MDRAIFYFSWHRQSSLDDERSTLVEGSQVPGLVEWCGGPCEINLTIPQKLEPLGTKVHQYYSALIALQRERQSPPATFAMKRFRAVISSLEADGNLTSTALIGQLKTERFAPVELGSGARWKLDTAWGMPALELLLWLWHAHHRPIKTLRLPKLPDFDGFTELKWWHRAKAFLLHTYPAPELLPHFKNAIPEERHGLARREYVIDHLRRRFRNFAPSN